MSLFKGNELKFKHIAIYVPVFSISLSFVYQLQITINSMLDQRICFDKIRNFINIEFLDMVIFYFFPGIFVSSVSLVVTLIFSSATNFGLLKSYWKFWALHSLITFGFFFALILKFSEDDIDGTSMLDYILAILSLSIPYLVSLPLSGIVTILISNFSARHLKKNLK